MSKSIVFISQNLEDVNTIKIQRFQNKCHFILEDPVIWNFGRLQFDQKCLLSWSSSSDIYEALNVTKEILRNILNYVKKQHYTYIHLERELQAQKA